ncbi:MAG: DUF2378 family protein [Deltaproteobacteria bacterium]|nr:DUF2378 family protein [Deltaproteobacteria bacterium]
MAADKSKAGALAEDLASAEPSFLRGLEACFAKTDLAWRLAQIPKHYAVRGVFMNMLDERAAELGAESQAAYADFFGVTKFSQIRLYSVKDYLIRLVKLSELHFGADRIHEGLFEIQAAAFPAWRRSLPGRMTFAVLGSNCDAILRMTNLGMSAAINHGTCVITSTGPGTYTAAFRDQPNFIEHAMAGALVGVARSCGLTATAQARMIDAFNGDILLTIGEPEAPK